MKEKIAIIGASYLQLPLIEKAKEMGFETHVFAWKAGDVGETAADHFYPISIVEKEAILEQCRKIGICGICSIASDLAAIAVNYVAERMGLPGNSWEATVRSTNKHQMRLAFEQHGDPSPRSILVDENTDLDALQLEFPVIIKPTDRSGSRGICKLESTQGLKEAVKAALDQGFEKKALIEEFAEGKEYSVEFISCGGRHTFLALTEKSTTGAPHFIENGHLEPARVSDEVREKIRKVICHALDSLGIENGASHSEVKVDEKENIRIIEIGGRMGGDCIGSDLVRYSTGYDFVKMVIDVACGRKPDFKKVCEPAPAAIRFIFSKEDLENFYRMQLQQPERILKLVDLHPERIGRISDSSNRAGCYIYRP